MHTISEASQHMQIRAPHEHERRRLRNDAEQMACADRRPGLRPGREPRPVGGQTVWSTSFDWRSATRRLSARLPSSAMARTERITVRMTSEQRALIATGAALVGESLSAFMRTAALESADHTLAHHERLAKIDSHLVTATRHPAGTTDRLRAPDRERSY